MATAFVIALVAVLFSAQPGGVRVLRTAKQMQIDDIQYFTGKSFVYTYPRSPLRIQWQLLLGKLGRKMPSTMTMSGRGPVLIVLTHIQGAARSKYVDLISVDGRSAHFPFPLMSVSSSDTNLFLLEYSLFGVNDTDDYDLSGGSYALRMEGETNDLAIIRVR